MVEKTLGPKYKIDKTKKLVEEPIKIDKEEKTVTINTRSETYQGFKKPDKLLLEDVALALSITLTKSKSLEEVDKLFWKVLKDITEYRR